jgi:carboxyl-terminal processing protease
MYEHKTEIMKGLMRGFFGAALLFLAGNAFGFVADTTQFKPKPVYGKEAKVIAYLLDNNHYRKIRLNDSLSSVILDKYIQSLDNNKSYFLASDLAGFEKYRKQIDDLITC